MSYKFFKYTLCGRRYNQGTETVLKIRGKYSAAIVVKQRQNISICIMSHTVQGFFFPEYDLRINKQRISFNVTEEEICSE